jgi:Fe-S-cluster containining protein
MFGGVDVSIRRAEHRAFMAEEEEKHHDRARNNGLKSCQRCGFCCLKQPCVPSPGEFNAVADYLGITPRELASEYAVVNEEKNGFYLLWARETQMDIVGRALPYYRTYDRGYCVFFDKENHACKIHQARPKTAKDTKCWKDKTGPSGVHWSTDQIKALLPDFNPNAGDLYVVNRNGTVSLLRIF